jgi:WNK lysine deficient protein kinase
MVVKYKELDSLVPMQQLHLFLIYQFINLCQVNLRGFVDEPIMLNRLFGEVRLLKSLHHPHIISLHKQWVNPDTQTLNFITEICNSGDLRGYRRKHKQISLKALKKWAHQILMGLDYLHTHEPCVIHRDLNCSNIFINGNVGEV